MLPELLRTIYFSYVHCIISYGIIFWGNSSHNKIIFKIQKKIIRVIMNSSSRSLCCDLFKKLNILLLHPSNCSLLRTEIYLDLNLKYIILVQDTILTYIDIQQIEWYFKRDLFILELIFNHLP